MKKVKWYIIGRIPDEYSDIIGIYDSEEEARQALKELKDPKNIDPFYDDFIAAGGNLQVEDENGNG